MLVACCHLSVCNGYSSFGCHVTDSDMAPGLHLIMGMGGGRGCVDLPGLVVVLVGTHCHLWVVVGTCQSPVLVHIVVVVVGGHRHWWRVVVVDCCHGSWHHGIVILIFTVNMACVDELLV